MWIRSRSVMLGYGVFLSRAEDIALLRALSMRAVSSAAAAGAPDNAASRARPERRFLDVHQIKAASTFIDNRCR